jgi:hypothetical protein
MMPGTWNERVKKLPGGVWSKISAQGNPLDLKYMDGNSIIELVTFSLREFYEARNLVPPYPVYPFNENQLRDIGKEKPTVREVLQWCRDNCKPPIDGDTRPEEELADPVELAFTKELEEELGGYLDNNFLLADALFFGFQTLMMMSQTVERVAISEEQIYKFIAEKGAEKKLGASNPLLREILSDPSYQIPVIEEEPETSVASSMTDTPEASETGGLSELIGNE